MRKQELHPRTAVINKTQKNHSKRARTDALLWLAVQFPDAFDNTLRIRPLKIGIMDDILLHADKAAEVGISKSKLREAVVLFTRRLDYLACLKLREARIDLSGKEIGVVSEEEADNAAIKIKKRVEKSTRNARKSMTEKQTSRPSSNQKNALYHSNTINSSNNHQEDHFPIYPIRSMNTAINATSQPARATTVVVKHKATKQYDPNAVARLKEKLGLSRNTEKKEVLEN